MYKILIVCHNSKIRNTIEQYIRGKHRAIMSADNCHQAETILNTLKIDFFVIVSTKSHNNTDIVGRIRKSCLYRFTPIALLSYYDSLFNELEDMKLVFRIKIPFSEKSLSAVNEFINHDISVSQSASPAKTFLILNSSSDFMRIRVDTILFFESSGHGCVIYTSDGEYSLPFTLKEISLHIENTPLYRCHRSYIVNTENIQKIDKTISSSWELHFFGCDKTALVSHGNKKILSEILEKTPEYV